MTKILRRKVLDNCSPLFYNDDRRGMKKLEPRGQDSI